MRRLTPFRLLALARLSARAAKQWRLFGVGNDRGYLEIDVAIPSGAGLSCSAPSLGQGRISALTGVDPYRDCIALPDAAAEGGGPTNPPRRILVNRTAYGGARNRLPPPPA